MKRRLLISIMVLLLFSFLAGCTKSPDPKAAFDEKLTYYYGAIENNIFTNDFLGMTMEVPGDWFVVEDQIKQQIQTNAYDMLSIGENVEESIKIEELKVYNLLFLFKNPVENQNEFNPSLLTIVERLDESNVQTENEYLKLTQSLMASNELPMGFEYTFKDEFEKESVGGNEFTVMEVVLDTLIVEIHQKFYCKIFDDKALCFVVSYSNDEEEKEIQDIIYTLNLK